MSHKCKPPREMQSEWIGDAALRMLVYIVLSERYPDEYPGALKGRVDAYVNNAFLTRFCRESGMEGGCNTMERTLGRLIQVDFYRCKRLVENLVDFGTTVRQEKAFKERMERFNRTRCAVRPVPCACGSFNLNIWRMPAKVVCRDCGREFVPSVPVKNTGQTIEAWNQERKEHKDAGQSC